MTKTTLNVLFKKMQKDDKKEVLEFHVQGNELPNTQELVGLAGSIVILNVEESNAGTFNAEFVSVQKDSKKTTLKFNIKGDSDDKVIKLYPHAGRSVTLFMEPSQMSVDDFYEEDDHEGFEYKIDKDGTANVSPNQMTLDELDQEESEVQDETDKKEDDHDDPFADVNLSDDDSLE
ncbi:hypothetical protein [Peribacillus frigoritolerans]|uniref:hypothetical protein n=1 Tax=Peribacillus frigoritolerans TaxID=450367 RepID=UPI0023DB4385|nr:hypothetical protein [Peribacillus frigoritolerans]MDF1997631.1 hypothetical protein [Peribacillus frigoritolerans]